jgi:hypothetical protein
VVLSGGEEMEEAPLPASVPLFLLSLWLAVWWVIEADGPKAADSFEGENLHEVTYSIIRVKKLAFN